MKRFIPIALLTLSLPFLLGASVIITGPVSQGVSGSFVPTDQAGLQVWVKADSGAGSSDTDPVATWTLAGGSGSDFTQATSGKRPQYRTACKNGLPCVRFDATDDALDTGSIAHGIGAGDFYIAAAVKTPGALSGFMTFWSLGSFAPALYFIGTGNTWDFYLAGGHSFTGIPSTGTWYIVELWRSGTTITLMVNGVANATTPTSSTSIANGVFRLNWDGSGDYAGMDLGELVFYNVLPSSGTRLNIRTYLNSVARWAVY